MRTGGILHSVALLAAMSSFAMSCSHVDFRNDDNGSEVQMNPAETDILFNFDWSGVSGSGNELPVAMTVAMSRIKNTVHYVYCLDNQGNFVEQPSPSETETVGIGDYYAMAIAHGTEDYNYTIVGLDEFASDLDVPMTAISASIPALTKAEILAADLLEFNPTCPYIHSADLLYSEVKKFSLPPVDGNDPSVSRTEDGHVMITISPRKITRDITFRVSIRHEDDVNVERLVGVISGVPRSISMMTGIVADSERRATGKVNFEMAEISSEGSRHVYEGKTGVLGLFPSEDPSFITGPGILQLFIRASAMENDIRRERLLHASLNLYELITKENLMLPVDEYEKSGWRSTKDATLDVGTQLKITAEQVISGNNQGLVEWKDDNDDINVEV